MFNRKECNFCGEKVKTKFEFCPSCGNSIKGKKKQENNGILGSNDLAQELEGLKLPPGFNMLLKPLMKELNKQMSGLNEGMQKDLKKQMNPKGNGISISISTNGNMPPKIKMNDAQTGEEKIPTIMHKSKSFSTTAKENFSKLPREEPQTNIRRLSDKIIYEIDLPGVESIKEIAFIKLENSIEIKAVSKEKSYKKIIKIDFPISHYSLENEKLILELLTKE